MRGLARPGRIPPRAASHPSTARCASSIVGHCYALLKPDAEPRGCRRQPHRQHDGRDVRHLVGMDAWQSRMMSRESRRLTKCTVNTIVSTFHAMCFIFLSDGVALKGPALKQLCLIEASSALRGDCRGAAGQQSKARRYTTHARRMSVSYPPGVPAPPTTTECLAFTLTCYHFKRVSFSH